MYTLRLAFRSASPLRAWCCPSAPVGAGLGAVKPSTESYSTVLVQY